MEKKELTKLIEALDLAGFEVVEIKRGQYPGVSTLDGTTDVKIRHKKENG